MTNSSRFATPMPWMLRVVTYAIALLVGFGIGFVPMWVMSRQSASILAEATGRAELVGAQNTRAAAVAAHQIEMARMQNTLASAAIDAQRGDYESARQGVSDFYTALREQANKGDASGLSQTQRDAVESVFVRRDETISLLARSDPAAKERLSDLYMSFREFIGK